MALCRTILLKLYKGFPDCSSLLAENVFSVYSVRNASKHWDPKFRWNRRMKIVKVDLPDFHEKEPDDMTREEIRSKMKESGVLPPRHWVERPMYVSSTGGVFEAYVPPEGDGRVSIISKEGAKQSVIALEKKSKSMMAIRKIRTYEEDFDPKEFVQHAQEVYISAHTSLMNKNAEELSEYVTERANPDMMNNLKNKTLQWKFIESIEPPRVVHARCTNIINKTNIFAQITVRFHTKQMLAIHDRFGRLMYGSNILAKDVLEYIVFEKHIVNQYGKWRVHEKIIPDWLPVGEPAPKTHQVEPDIDDEAAKVLAQQQEGNKTTVKDFLMKAV